MLAFLNGKSMWVTLDHLFSNLRVNQIYCPIGGDNIPLEENFEPMKNAKLHNFYKSQKLLVVIDEDFCNLCSIERVFSKIQSDFLIK